tara:strand:- start:125 stop:955 length:831 start_codon:yes stop_codon:yes gene_type:complete
MQTRLDKNQWTVYVDEDINSLNKQQIEQVIRLVVSNMVVVFKEQSMTPEQEVDFCKVAGTVQYYPSDFERTKHIAVGNHILRVTGEKNAECEPGLFGHVSALDWHANQCSNKNRDPLIWLYGVKGTAGSRTSWINMIEAYKALPDNIKNYIDDLQIYCGYESGKYSTSNFFKDHVNKDNLFDLVMENKEGQKGLYFPFLQTFGVDNLDEEEYNNIWKLLYDHVLDEKFMYHHDWSDGDIVISEQWLSVHKRWEFHGMNERVLHRIAFNYDKIYGDK